MEEVKNDSSLTPLKDLADRYARGYYWDDGVLMQRHSDVAFGVIENIIVPKSRRSDLIHLAHDKTGHLGYKKVIRIIKQNFVWPLMNRDTQTNGVLERLHATLEAILGKARALGLDWVGQIPFVLFALRQAPNRTTGFSP